MEPRYSPEVGAARASNTPLVALETTVLAHGLPPEVALETAHGLGEAVREVGAVPAHTAVLEGQIRVGLSPEELERLCQQDSVRKLSRNNLASCVASGETGATTVAGTLCCARMAGIEVMATGGLGGVHRGAETSFDISADLGELARCSAAVVCSGSKSLLDLPKTVELLEAMGVPIVGYRTSEFPAFYTAHSGLALSARTETPREAALIAKAQFDLALGGLVIANPPPEQLRRDDLEHWLELALEAAQRAGIRGAEVTPYVLQTLTQLSRGETLRVNTALLASNARLAAQIAMALAEVHS